MSIQPISTASAIYPQEEPQIGCWERFKEGIGWIVSKVICLVSAIGKVILWPLQIICCLAFKALGVVWPDIAAHLMLIGERVITAAREEELLNEMEELRLENKSLKEAVDAQGIRIEEFQVKDNHQAWELETIQEERDAARHERDQRLEGRLRLTREKEQLAVALNEALIAKEAQQLELTQARQEMEVIKGQLAQENRNNDLLEQFRKIDAAYKERELEQEDVPNATELQLQQLIPIYEAQKQAYSQMIQSVLEDIPAEHELQIPLKGILRLFNDEAQHLKRISQEIHFYAELKGPINSLRRAIT